MRKIYYFVSFILLISLFSPLSNVFAESSTIEVNTEYKGNIQDSDEEDFYLFTIPSKGKVSLNFKHQLVEKNDWANYWNIYLLNQDNEVVTSFSSTGKELNQNSNTVRLPSGTYSVKVTSSSYNSAVDYSLKVNFTSEDTSYESEPNQDFLNSNSIQVNSVYNGNTQDSDDQDFYQFELKSKGKLSINFKHQLITQNDWANYWNIQLRNEDNEEITTFYSKGSTLNVDSNHFYQVS